MGWSKTAEIWKNPPIGQSQEANGLGQNNRKSSKCSKPEELHEERIGAKQQKIKQMLQTGRIEQRVSWSKNLKYGKIPQLGSHRKQVSWGKTTEIQANAPNRKN